MDIPAEHALSMESSSTKAAYVNERLLLILLEVIQTTALWLFAVVDVVPVVVTKNSSLSFFLPVTEPRHIMIS